MGVRQAFPSLKTREPRVRTFVPARMLLGARWADAFILNVSSRGLLIQSAESLERGAYIELRRGDQVIIARVVWRVGSRAGLRAQDRVPIEAIVTTRGQRADRAADGATDPVGSDRRPEPRHDQTHRHDRSRLRGRAIEFTSVALIGATLSFAVFSLVAEALADPLSKVRTALSAQASLPADSR